MPRKIFFTPGPAELYFTVEGHLKNALREQIPSISHRGEQFKKIYQHTESGLRELLRLPDDYQIFFTSSATEIWEHLIRNCVESESYHLVNGAFSRRFCDFSGMLSRRNTSLISPDGSCAQPEEVHPGGAELIGVTLNESSTGVGFPTSYLSDIRKDHSECLIAVDGVSSIPIPDLDYSNVDSAYFSVQKSFGLPAGLGVWIVGPRCFEKAELLNKSGRNLGTYRSLLELHKKGRDHQTIETPNVLNIYLLGKVIEDMLTKGLDMIRRESKYKMAVLHQQIEDTAWLSQFVENKNYRSETVIVAKCERPNQEVVEELHNQGFVIGQGYGKYKSEHLRFANFPTHSKEIFERLVDVLAEI